MQSTYVKFIKKYILKEKSLFIVVSLVTIIQSIISVCIPLTYALLIDKALPQKKVSLFILGVAGMLGCYLVNSILNVAKDYFLGKISEKLSFRLRKELNDKISVLEYSFFDKYNLSEVLSKYNKEVDSIKDSCGYMLLRMFSNIVTLISTCAMILYLNWRILIISLILLVVYIFCNRYWGKKVKVLAEKSMEYNQGSINCITDNYENVLVTKLMNAYTYVNKRFLDTYKKQYDNAIQLELIYSININSCTLIIYLLTGIVWILGGREVFNNTITIGVVIALINYNSMLLSPANFFCQFNNSYQSTVNAIERLSFIFDYSEEKQDSVLKLDDRIHEIKLSNIYFSYDKIVPVIRNANAIIQKGEITAFMGSSGSGKSTITKLLLGLYEPQNGEIYFNKSKLSDVSINNLRDKIAYIPQESHFYNDSILENLLLSGNNNDKEIERISKSLDLYDEIASLPKQWNTKLSSGASNLSGGQKKRLDVLRALLKNSEVLIFDECTASIDVKRREKLFKILDEIKYDKIIIFISHNVEESKHYDKIYELKDAEIFTTYQYDVANA